jgi:hypothetical protein
MDVTVRQDFTPTLNVQRTYNVFFPMEIAAPDSLSVKITSNLFTFNGVLCTIKTEMVSTKLQIVDVEDRVVVDNIGQYFPITGEVRIVGFAPQSIQTGAAINLTVIPANQSTIRPLRNYILDLNSSSTSARGVLDYQTTIAAL